MTNEPKIRAAKTAEVVSFRRKDVEADIAVTAVKLRELDALREHLLGRMQTLQQLLRYFDPDQTLGGHATSEESAPRTPSAAERKAAVQIANERMYRAESSREKLETLADLAYDTLMKIPGGTATTGGIATKLALDGRPIGGAMPFATLTTALRRDPRFERVPGQRALWRLDLPHGEIQTWPPEEGSP